MKNIIDLVVNLSKNGIHLYLEEGKLKVNFPEGSSDEALLSQVRESKFELIQYLSSLPEEMSDEIPAAELRDGYPLSSSQRRLWVLSQLSNANAAYNMPAAFVFKGKLDKEILDKAFLTLIHRHEILRTIFSRGDREEVWQYVQAIQDTEFSIGYEDLQGVNNQSVKVEEKVKDAFQEAFDLNKFPLLRSRLYRIANEEWVFCCVMHHIITDGWSIEVMIRELLVLYNSFVSDQESPLTPLRIQYKDYAVWQQNQLLGGALAAHKDYWVNQFSGELPVLELPTAYVRPSIKTFSGGTTKSFIGKELTQELKIICQRQECTLFMGLLSCIYALFYRYTSQQDIVLGTPIASRNHGDLENQIGFYVNSLPLRGRFSGEVCFTELLYMVKQTVLDAYEHQRFPFDELVEALALQRDVSRSPLYDVEVLLHNAVSKESINDDQFSNLEVSRYYCESSQASRFDLVFDFTEQESGMELNITFNSEIYSEPLVNRYATHLVQLIKCVLSDPLQSLKSLDYLDVQEKNKLLKIANAMEDTGSSNQTLVDLFESQVVQNPDEVAVFFEDNSITYGELNDQANSLGHYLSETCQVHSGDVIGIIMDRSDQAVVAILGVLKSGAAYVPIDPQLPKSRRSFIIADTKAKVLITQTEYMFELDYYTGQVFAMDIQMELLKPGVVKPSAPVYSHDLAYLIYTSGSTGKPKAVMISHGAIVNTIKSQREIFEVSPGERGLQFASLAFDASVSEIFVSLSCGGTLYIVPESDKKIPERMQAYLQKHQIDMATIPPGYLQQLNIEKLPLKKLITAGEPAHVGSVNRFCEKGIYYNAYGPTETSICATVFRIDKGDKLDLGQVPIGAPISNVKVYIVDEYLNLVPVGVVGEICIGGAGLANGYLNDTDSSERKFVTNPFHEDERLYRTGDMGKLLESGEIEFLGRKDQQVKIRGHRIELGEIECALLDHKSVEQSVVVAMPNQVGDLELAAYVVGDSTLKVVDIRNHLYSTLPEYMIPAHCVVLEQMPYTLNGKINKKALPNPMDLEVKSRANYVAPRDQVEQGIAEIWAKVLGKDRVGIQESFFDLGGDSIKIIRMTSELKRVLDIDMPIAEIYQHNTIESLLKFFHQNTPEVDQQNQKRKEMELAIAAEICQLKDRILSEGLIPDKENIADIYPMSDIEKGMMYESLLYEGLPVYHDQMVYQRVFVDFSINRFSQALELLTKKHEILRTSFNLDHFEQPVQIVHHSISIPLYYEDLSNQPKELQQCAVQRYLESELNNPFHIGDVPLWRMGVFYLGSHELAFVFQCHHAIIDGWSDSLLMTELNNLYLKLCKDPLYCPTPLKASYKDFVIQHEIDRHDASIVSFWKQELAGYQRLDLFTKKIDVKKHYSYLKDDELARLEEIAIQLNTSVKVFSLAAYLYMLKVLSYGNEILTGLVTHTRPNCEDGDKILGCFLNTIPLKMDIHDGQQTVELIAQVHEKLISLKGKENLSMFEISRIYDEPNQATNPFFDILFNYVDFHSYNDINPGDHTHGDEDHSSLLGVQGNSQTNFNLNFIINRTGGRYLISISSSKELISGYTPEKLGVLYRQILGHLCDPNQKLDREDYLSLEEKNRLHAFGDNNVAHQKGKTLLDLFSEQVKRASSQRAVVFGGAALTYRELDEKSNQLANYLLEEYHIQANDLIGIMMDTSEKSIIAMMAVMKSGGAYLPIDPDFPKSRKAYMLEDANVRVLITESDYMFALDYYHGGIVALDIQWDTLETDKALLKNDVSEDQLAYVIYTSGSTGEPKGVLINHKSVVDYFYGILEVTNIGDCKTFGLVSSMAADLGNTVIYPSLMLGGELQLFSKEDTMDILKMREASIDVLKITPYHWKALQAEGQLFVPDKCLIFGGEELTTDVLECLKEFGCQCAVYNHYGPTEATIGKLIKQVALFDKQDKVLLGRPFGNSQISILDDNMKMVPVGVPGEICIGGAGVALGYLNKPLLTHKKFVKNPQGNGEVVYKTGDLGRWTPDGNIEFVGRKDNQVKIRGYRVELGEIAGAIQTYQGVEDAVVIKRTMDHNEGVLIAYLVSHETCDIGKMKFYLGEHLPNYMIPDYFIRVETLPLTVNGKIDKKALPDPNRFGRNVQSEYVQPRTEVEKKLIEIWERVLSKESIGIQDNFFELGGHSIKAVQLIFEIQKYFNIRITIEKLFAEPRIIDLGAEIESLMWVNEEGEIVPESQKITI